MESSSDGRDAGQHRASAPETDSFSPPESTPSSPPRVANLPSLTPSAAVNHRSSLRPDSLRTPGSANDTSNDYFSDLAPVPSLQSRISATSAAASAAASAASASGPFSPQETQTRTRQGLPRRPSIRIRRRQNTAAEPSESTGNDATAPESRLNLDSTQCYDAALTGRRRSHSQPVARSVTAPDATQLTRPPQPNSQMPLPRLTEEGSRPGLPELGVGDMSLTPTISLPEDDATSSQPSRNQSEADARNTARKGKFGRKLWPGFGRRRGQPTQESAARPQDDEYDERLVDWLDTIDPEIQTLSTLTNVQNSLFVPDLGGWVNRRPTYNLSQREPGIQRPSSAQNTHQQAQQDATGQNEVDDGTTRPAAESLQVPPPMQRTNTITSRLSESHYAALPHGTTLEGWTAAEKLELDDHVRHMLHSRRAKFKRTMKGFGQYVRRPLGFFVTLYATLITLFGLAWVLFLIGWIYVGDKQVYTIHIIDSVLVALFAVMGDGLAPFRAVDTYHLIFVVRYSQMLKKAAKKADINLGERVEEGNSATTAAVEQTQPMHSIGPGTTGTEQPGDTLANRNRDTSDRSTDSCAVLAEDNADVEEARSTTSQIFEDSPLTAAQHKSLEHHQTKLAKSHSFYKPHETFTHRPFPLGSLIAIVVLLDCHSCLQISLGACTWGIDYHHRPMAITTVILCVSITCNLTAGLVISLGDRKTRKKDVVNLLNRQELTEDAMKEIQHEKKKEEEEKGDRRQSNELSNKDGRK